MYVVGPPGHVDHGKSALVQALTGIDPDRLREGKERGLTIELGFAWLTLPNGAQGGPAGVARRARSRCRGRTAGTRTWGSSGGRTWSSPGGPRPPKGPPPWSAPPSAGRG